MLGGPAPIYLDGTLKPMTGNGLFRKPHGITVDSDGNIYVCEWNSGGRAPIKLTKV